MKEGARYIAIASGPIRKGGRALIVGIIFRESYIEGVLSGSAEVDGTDSTSRIIKMIKQSRFGDQIRILLLNGIAIAGLNIIDPVLLEKDLHVKVVLLNRRKQDAKELVKALSTFSKAEGAEVKDRIKIVQAYSSVRQIRKNGLFLQSTLEDHYLSRFAERAFEALRISHIMASGISTGESKGRL